MIETAVGMAVFFAIILLGKRKFEVSGLFGILIFGAICYGMGYLIVDVIGKAIHG